MVDPQKTARIITTILEDIRWLETAPKYMPELLADQYLLKHGYEISFAIDFNELRHLFHPFEAVGADPEADRRESLYSIWACGYLLNVGGRRSGIGKSVLLYPYLVELANHVHYLRDEVLTLTTEWSRCRDEIARLQSDSRIQRLYRDLGQETGDTIDELVGLGRFVVDEFPNLARVFYASRFGGRPGHAKILLDVQRDFIVDQDILDDSADRRLVGGLAEAIWGNRPTRRNVGAGVDVNTIRDAEALVRCSRINQNHHREQRRAITYLLTSTAAIHKLRDELRQGDERLKPLYSEVPEKYLPPELGARDLQDSRVWIVRHPMHIVLYLCYFAQTNSDEDLQQRRESLRSIIENEIQRLTLQRSILEEARVKLGVTIRELRAGTSAVDREDMASEAGEFPRELHNLVGPWRNLSLAMERNDILPFDLAPSQERADLIKFIDDLQARGWNKEEFSALLAEKSTGLSDKLVNLLHEQTRSRLRVEITGESVAVRRGHVGGYPYVIRFGTGEAAELVAKARMACEKVVAREGLGEKEIQRRNADCVRAISELVDAVRDKPALGVRSRVLIVASLLFLLKDYKSISRLLRVRAGTGREDEEYHYISCRALYLSARSNPHTNAERIVSTRAYIQRHAERSQDPRLYNLLALAYLWEATEGEARDQANRAKASLAKSSELLREWKAIDAEKTWLRGAIADNQVCVIAAQGYLTDEMELQRKAFDLAKEELGRAILPPELYFGIAFALAVWAVRSIEATPDDRTTAREMIRKAQDEQDACLVPYREYDIRLLSNLGRELEKQA